MPISQAAVTAAVTPLPFHDPLIFANASLGNSLEDVAAGEFELFILLCTQSNAGQI